MGVDLRVILGHKLTLKDIIEFPYFLTNNKHLKEVYIGEIQSKLDHHYSIEQALSMLEKKYYWENITETELLKSWTNNENPQLVDDNGYIAYSLNTYFGLIYFNRQTIEIMYFPEHKYSNLSFESHRKFILNFSTAMAKSIGTNEIVYCSDTYSTEIIENWASEGRSIEAIIKLAIEKFGLPPVSLEKAIEHRFFIDDSRNPIIQRKDGEQNGSS